MTVFESTASSDIKTSPSLPSLGTRSLLRGRLEIPSQTIPSRMSESEQIFWRLGCSGWFADRLDVGTQDWLRGKK